MKSVVAACVLATAVLADKETKTASFSVRAHGSSGKLTVCPLDADLEAADQCIALSQDKIEIRDAAGKPAQNFNVAGQNDWSDFVETGGVLRTEFTTTDNKGQTFSLLVEVASTTTEVDGPAKACDECASETSGMCKSTADSKCADQVVVEESGGDKNTEEGGGRKRRDSHLACPADHTLCVHKYKIRDDAVEFTPKFTNFNWPAGHTLSYGVGIKAPKGEQSGEGAEVSGDSYSLAVGATGSVSSATECLVVREKDGPAEKVAVAQPVITTKSNGDTSCEWNFGATIAGAYEVTYDPSISLSPASFAVPSFLVSMGALLALF